MSRQDAIRPGRRSDALACAHILNDWIDGCDWMPRLHTPQSVETFYHDTVFENCEVHVAGTPVCGFLALDVARNLVTALYVAEPGRGIGKRLLDAAKSGRDWLELWTFQANTDARRFYKREGFAELRRTDNDNEENLPDIFLRWHR